MDISRDIITRAADGDIKAFEVIYRETAGFVYNIALRVTKSSEDAEEVTQDVFMKIYKNLKDFRSLSTLKTWIYRITINTAINYKKKAEKHIKKCVDNDPNFQPVFTEETARENIDKQNKREQISTLLDMLNPDQRACIILREIESLNYKEIAKVLKININTVRSRLKRAREKLLALVGER